MPRAAIAPDEAYHIFNRGVNKQRVFLEDTDYIRMLLLILSFQSPKIFYNISRYVKNFKNHKDFGLSKNITSEILDTKAVELISFALMPNHFHLFVQELEEGGISKYLQRIEIAYTKYFNTKYRRSGYLFQGPFQSVHVDSNEQALYLSAYIHLNPREFKQWQKKEHLYPWSSYQDLINKNRWGELLEHDIISGQFSTPTEYKHFIETSGAKDLDDDIRLD